MNLIEKLKHKTAGLSNSEIAKEAALMVKGRLIHHYRHAKALFSKTDISDEKLMRALMLPNSKSLFKHFKKRETPPIFGGLQGARLTCELYTDYFLSSFESTIEEANRICDHKFAFLGRRLLYSSEEIDWHYDPTVDYHWPQLHYSQLQLDRAKEGADIKLPWELARLQHFITLGQAYQLTGDERYAIEFCNQLISFANANPPEIGIHWLCAMEVALRAISLSIAFYFFRSSPNFDEETLKVFLKLILSHAHYIESNLEFSHRITSNHYLSDLAGLLFIGRLFPEFKKANEWANFALSELLKEMDKQIYDDGVDWEASIPYHAFVLELFLYSFLLCKEHRIIIDNSYWYKLAKMFDFVRAYLKPDGSAPFIGDGDNGRVIVWQRREPADHSYLLSIAAITFEQDRFKTTGQPSEEALWLFGTTGWDTYASLPFNNEEPLSTAFPQGGIYIQRTDNLYTIIDCGEIGINGQGSHAHNDLLSFELFYREATFIVDPGSYIYTGDKTARNLFRSTPYHNTVMIDGEEINDIYPEKLFILANQAHPKINNWESTVEYDLLDAEHNGYMRLPEGIIHRRRLLFNKVGGYWLITDLLNGEGEHDFNFFFNIDSGIGVELAGNNRVIMTHEISGITLAIAPIDKEGLRAELVERSISRGYGHREPSWAVKYHLRSRVPEYRRFLIAPCNEEDLSGIDYLVELILSGTIIADED